MAFRKYTLFAVVLLAISGFLSGCGGSSVVAPITSNEAPMVAPSNVIAQVLVNGDILLRWDAGTQTNLKGYNVYRLDPEAQTIGKLNPSVLGTNQYLDGSAVSNVEYEYRITSVSVKGAESAYTSVSVINDTHRGTLKDTRPHNP